MNTRNDVLGVYDTMKNVGNDQVCIYCKFGLEVEC